MTRVLAAAALAALLLGACSSEPEPAASPSPTSTSPAPGPSPTAAEPEPVVPEHGGTYWAVYLAVGGETDLEDAIQYLTEVRNLELGAVAVGDVNCDEGAAEALGADPGSLRVAVYFDSSQDATAWAATLPADPVGIVEVRTFCLD